MVSTRNVGIRRERVPTEKKENGFNRGGGRRSEVTESVKKFLW